MANDRRIIRRGAGGLACSLLIAAVALPCAGAESVGEVAFANSGAAAAQAPFLRGLALLHDFEYEDAATSFRQAQSLDAGFAMAYWGEAMTYTHPVWMEQDAEAARGVLRRLGPTAAARAARAPTPRERAYLAAVEVLYGDGTKEQRDMRFAEAIAAVHAAYPDDVDATAFAALALLGTAHEGRDFATYMRAAALLEEVFPDHPRHPGVLHYLIHCYDDPLHAPLGMRAARLYGAVAPEAGHALHMTSHIFIALGRWDDVIAANERAMAVVDRHRLGAGKGTRRCGHYPEWLHYAYLQTGRLADADRLLEACRQEALAEPQAPAPSGGSPMRGADSWAEMRLQRIVDAGSAPAASLPLLDDRDAAARAAVAYGDAIAASRALDPAGVRAAAGRLAAAQGLANGRDHAAAMAGSTGAGAVIRRQVEALGLLAAGRRAEALTMLRTVATAEEALPLAFGPPAVEKPSRELLGEQLLAAGNASDAAAAFTAALARAPGRTAALRGLLSAQRSAHETSQAERTEAQLAGNLHRPPAAPPVPAPGSLPR